MFNITDSLHWAKTVSQEQKTTRQLLRQYWNSTQRYDHAQPTPDTSESHVAKFTAQKAPRVSPHAAFNLTSMLLVEPPQALPTAEH